MIYKDGSINRFTVFNHFLVVVVLVVVQAQENQREKPHIIMIVADDLGEFRGIKMHKICVCARAHVNNIHFTKNLIAARKNK